jgi:hypothetical protein
MFTSNEIKDKVEHLSSEELEDLGEIIHCRKEKELLKVVEDARKESAEGKTIVLSSSSETSLFLKR